MADTKNKAVAEADGPATLRVDIFIDLRSPYSYVAKGPLRALVGELGLVAHWRPYAIDINAAYGAAGARDARALRKVKYIYKDARRLGAAQGLEIRGPKRIYNADLAHIGMLYAGRAGLTDAYVDVLYERFFSHAIDIEDLASLQALIDEIGGSGADFRALVEGTGTAELAAHAGDAELLGVFGVPTVVYGKEIFWGSDRLPLLREAISARRRTN